MYKTMFSSLSPIACHTSSNDLLIEQTEPSPRVNRGDPSRDYSNYNEQWMKRDDEIRAQQERKASRAESNTATEDDEKV